LGTNSRPRAILGGRGERAGRRSPAVAPATGAAKDRGEGDGEPGRPPGCRLHLGYRSGLARLGFTGRHRLSSRPRERDDDRSTPSRLGGGVEDLGVTSTARDEVDRLEPGPPASIAGRLERGRGSVGATWAPRFLSPASWWSIRAVSFPKAGSLLFGAPGGRQYRRMVCFGQVIGSISVRARHFGA
jgi:hypothetical protein